MPKYNKIVTHIEAHGEECFAIAMIRKEGESKMPGSSTAKIELAKRKMIWTDEACDRAGIIPIACSPGTRFDEHLPAESDRERMADACASTLVNRYLGLENNPVYAGLLQEVFVCDTRPCAKVTQLSQLVKTMRREVLMGPIETIEWAVDGYSALIELERVKVAEGDFKKPIGMLTLGVIFECMCKVGFRDERVKERIRQVLKGSESNGAHFLTEIANVVTAMQVVDQTNGRERAMEWAKPAIQALYNEQSEFGKAVLAALQAPKRKFLALVDNDEREYQLVFNVTDSALFARAARSSDGGSNAIVIQKNTSGHVQIFADVRAGINLRKLAQMLRFLELKKQGMEVDWYSLYKEGEHVLVPNWYLHKNNLLNGSETHPTVTVTAIPFGVIVTTALHAFHPRLVSKWLRENGVADPVMQAQKKPQRPVPQAVVPKVPIKVERAPVKANGRDFDVALTTAVSMAEFEEVFARLEREAKKPS